MLEKDKAFISPTIKSMSEAVFILGQMREIVSTSKKCYVGEMYDILGKESSDDNGLMEQFWTEEDLLNAVIGNDEENETHYLMLPQPRLNVEKAPEKEPDMVSHPPHYQSPTGLEAIDVIKAFTQDLKGIQATDTGNIIKYICRWKSKNGLQDLKKAQWYLNHLINEVEKENE